MPQPAIDTEAACPAQGHGRSEPTPSHQPRTTIVLGPLLMPFLPFPAPQAHALRGALSDRPPTVHCPLPLAEPFRHLLRHTICTLRPRMGYIGTGVSGTREVLQRAWTSDWWHSPLSRLSRVRGRIGLPAALAGAA